MAKKKKLTVEDMEKILNTEIESKEEPQLPTDFEEAMKIVISYNPKEEKKKKDTKK